MAIDVRAQLENRLLTAPDTWERHLIVAQLVGSPRDLIDVGGLPKQLRSFLPNTNVSAVNVVPPADIIVAPGPLPFADQAYAAVTSLDALEHVLPTARPAFAAELVRVARDRAVVCCPFGSAEHAAAEQELQAWHRALTGSDHPWLAEHIENGLPTLDELHELFDAAPGRVTFLFHGDFREVGRQFKRIVRARHRHRVEDVSRYLSFRLAYHPTTELGDSPSVWTNRAFVVIERH
jgi:hypothetical protein